VTQVGGQKRAFERILHSPRRRIESARKLVNAVTDDVMTAEAAEAPPIQSLSRGASSELPCQLNTVLNTVAHRRRETTALCD
jgi:hypothetical protein